MPDVLVNFYFLSLPRSIFCFSLLYSMLWEADSARLHYICILAFSSIQPARSTNGELESRAEGDWGISSQIPPCYGAFSLATAVTLYDRSSCREAASPGLQFLWDSNTLFLPFVPFSLKEKNGFSLLVFSGCPQIPCLLLLSAHALSVPLLHSLHLNYLNESWFLTMHLTMHIIFLPFPSCQPWFGGQGFPQLPSTYHSAY